MPTTSYSPAGADFDSSHSSAMFALGTPGTAANDQRYVYVLCSGAITQYSALAIDESFVARQATTALAAEANSVGFAQIAVATDRYFWAAVHGHGLTTRTADNTAANATLYTTTTAGVLSSQASTGNPYLVAGVRAAAAAASGGGATTIVATYPQFNPRPATF